MVGLGMSVGQVAVRQKHAAAGGDTTAPGTVSDFYLVASNGVDDALLGTNNFPGNDGFGGGNATSYEIRAGIGAAITNNTQWNAAVVLDGPNSPASGLAAGSHQEFYLTPGGGDLYFAIRCKDAAGNQGGISNNVHVTLTG